MSEFSGLVEGEIPRLRRYARALTRSADRADDLVQETLLRLRCRSSLTGSGAWRDSSSWRLVLQVVCRMA